MLMANILHFCNCNYTPIKSSNSSCTKKDVYIKLKNNKKLQDNVASVINNKAFETSLLASRRKQGFKTVVQVNTNLMYSKLTVEEYKKLKLDNSEDNADIFDINDLISDNRRNFVSLINLVEGEVKDEDVVELEDNYIKINGKTIWLEAS